MAAKLQVPEGLTARKNKGGRWVWEYSSPGGSTFLAKPEGFATERAALTDGIKWIEDNR